MHLRIAARITSGKYLCKNGTRNVYRNVLIIFILGNLSLPFAGIFLSITRVNDDRYVYRDTESAGFLGSRENRHVPAVKFGVIRMSHLPT